MVFETKLPLPGQPPRHAEQSDTRQAIGRHEQDPRRRAPKREDDGAQHGFDENDEARISVESLRVFLENFSRTERAKGVRQSIENKDQSMIYADEEILSEPPAPLVSPYAAKAAQAYQSADRKTRTSTDVQDDYGERAANSPAGREDLKTVDRLLADLDRLTRAGIENLRIERADNFLESILRSVAAEIARI